LSDNLFLSPAKTKIISPLHTQPY